MKLITKEIMSKLESNSRMEIRSQCKPWLKLFNPAGGGTWLISEIKGDIMYGLCDLGHGSPELGSVSLKELESLKLPFGLKIERDMYFEPTKTLSEYAKEAREVRYITS